MQAFLPCEQKRCKMNNNLIKKFLAALQFFFFFCCSESEGLLMQNASERSRRVRAELESWCGAAGSVSVPPVGVDGGGTVMNASEPPPAFGRDSHEINTFYFYEVQFFSFIFFL